MGILRRIFGKKTGKPSMPVQVPINKEEGKWYPFYLSKDDPPIRIDISTISHAFIVLTLNDTQFTEIARKVVAECNRACFPQIWNVRFSAQFGTFAASPFGPDGYPNPVGLPTALEAVGMDYKHSSVVTQALEVSFAGANRSSKIRVGFAFREEHPRRLIFLSHSETGATKIIAK